MTLLVYPGRFQPPHKGHLKVIRTCLEKFPDAKIIVSIDVRRKDENNPFTLEFRKAIFEKHLSNLIDCGSVVISCHRCNELSVNGCLTAIKNCYPLADGVIAGKDRAPLFRDFGFNVIEIPERYYNLSSTSIRSKLRKQGYEKVYTYITR